MTRRMKGASGTAGDTGDSSVAVNVRVRVHPGTDGEVRGTVVEDFGDLAGHAVDIGENHVVGPARRWAWRSTRAVCFSSTATSWPPTSFSLSRFTSDRTLVNAPTARSRQVVCRCPLIRLPGDAIRVPPLRAAAQAARGALRGPCCVRLSA